jgi:hypothetical protein
MPNRHEIHTFYSKKNIRGAQQWHDEIGAALSRCSWFIVVLTPQSVASEWVKHEFVYALQDPRYRRRIVPVLYKLCDFKKLSWTLSAIEYVDFRKDFDDGCRELLALWNLTYRPAQRAKKG